MKKGTLKNVLRYAGKYRILIFLSMFLAVVTALLSLYVPILAGRAVDQLIGKDAVDFGKVINTELSVERSGKNLAKL